MTAYEKAQIPPVASFDSYKTDISGRVPKGTATSITLAAAPAHKVEAKDANDMPVDNRQGTITVSAEGLQVGDAFTIAGVNSVHQITKDTTGQPQVFRALAVSGTTVTISRKFCRLTTQMSPAVHMQTLMLTRQMVQQSPFSTKMPHRLTCSGLMVLLS